MRNTRTRSTSARIAVAGLASFALLGLAGCGDSEEKAESAPPPSSASESPAPTEEPTESEDSAAGGSAEQPDWANPVTTPGEEIASIKAGDVTVKVYQVGTTKATKTGQFVDPKNNKPIIAQGDEIVFVNYVATNNGEAIDLGSSGVSVDARYEDWPYMQGMDSIVDKALFEQQKVNDTAFAPGSYKDPSVYTFGSGQTISWAENFRYQKGSPIEFKVTMTPVDAKGDLLHDGRVEAEGSGKIK